MKLNLIEAGLMTEDEKKRKMNHTIFPSICCKISFLVLKSYVSIASLIYLVPCILILPIFYCPIKIPSPAKRFPECLRWKYLLLSLFLYLMLFGIFHRVCDFLIHVLLIYMYGWFVWPEWKGLEDRDNVLPILVSSRHRE